MRKGSVPVRELGRFPLWKGIVYIVERSGHLASISVDATMDLRRFER